MLDTGVDPLLGVVVIILGLIFFLMAICKCFKEEIMSVEDEKGEEK